MRRRPPASRQNAHGLRLSADRESRCSHPVHPPVSPRLGARAWNVTRTCSFTGCGAANARPSRAISSCTALPFTTSCGGSCATERTPSPPRRKSSHGVYRRILLHDGPLDLSGWTYGAAIDVCRERLDEREADHRATGGPEADGSEPNDLGRRFGQALGDGGVPLSGRASSPRCHRTESCGPGERLRPDGGRSRRSPVPGP